jgi:hypothetical protein
MYSSSSSSIPTLSFLAPVVRSGRLNPLIHALGSLLNPCCTIVVILDPIAEILAKPTLLAAAMAIYKSLRSSTSTCTTTSAVAMAQGFAGLAPIVLARRRR